MSRGRGYNLFLTSEEAVVALDQPADADLGAPTDVVRLQLIGANADAVATGLAPQPGEINYLLGNDPDKWQTGITPYGKVRYDEVYPGIDLVYYGTSQSQLEYDFIVSPRVDPDIIRLRFEGAEGRHLDADGNLVLTTPGGEVVFRAPVVYQRSENGRQVVEGSYRLANDGTLAFSLGPYDERVPLIIDPVLSYATYHGGADDDQAQDIAVDASGNAYVVGFTKSTDFPTQNAFDAVLNPGTQDGFVVKIDPTGTALVYATYLGGTAFDDAQAVAVDASGNAYVTGITGSTNFPTAGTPIRSVNGGGLDIFVSKLNPAGSALVYSTYLGVDTTTERGFGIVVDSSGNAIVAGETASLNFPTVNPHQSTFGGDLRDAIVVKLNAAGSALVYSTYLGGSGVDEARQIAIDGSGNVFITGFTGSSDFPVVSALDGTYNGVQDAFVTKIDPSGTVLFSTYLGGSADETGFGIAVDASGNAYATGFTASSDFPTAGTPFQSTFGGNHDAYVTKYNSDGSALVYSTYIGGTTSQDRGYAIAVDGDGSAYITGLAQSSDLPLVDAFQPTPGSPEDAFIAKLNSTGSALVYSSYIGGSGDNEFGFGIAVDGSGNAYVAGRTVSTDFPSELAIQGTNGGGLYDAWVAKIVPLVSISSFSPTSGKIGDSVTITGTNFDATASNNTVRFGGTEATVTSASTTSLTATVPTAANFAPINITVNNRTAESRDFFLPTFASEFPTIDASNFAAKVDFTTAAGPLLSIPADIDGDGKTDLVVLNQSASSFSVFRNTSTLGTIDGSTYAAKVDFTTGTTPAGMAIADYDGNGVVDVSTTNSATDDVSVFRNTSTVGSVSFAAKVEYTAGDQPTVMIARDMDLDGKTDMVTANNLTADVSVIRNTSTPGTIDASSFAAKVDFTVGTQPREVAVGDIDGDDLPDIAAGNFSTNNFSVLRSTSTPGTITASSFAGKVDFAALINPEGLEIVDLDGDGAEDVAVANFSSSMISVFRNTSVSGTPSFATRVDYTSGVQPQDIAIGDIDGDGKPDIAAGNANFGTGVTVSVLRNTSTSGTIDANSFTPKVDFTTPLNPIQSTIVDVDGDGKPELISANGGAASISVFRNITPTTPAPTITAVSPLLGKIDDTITITGTNFDATTTNNTVRFCNAQATVTSASTTSLSATVPAGATAEPIRVTVNDRTAESETFFLPTYSGVAQTITAGSFASRFDFASGNVPMRAAIGDIDGDGKPDIAVTNQTDSDVSIYRNTSVAGGFNAGSLATKFDFTTGVSPRGLTLGDFDNDGALDLIVAEQGANINLFHNTATSGVINASTFAAKVDIAVSSSREITSADLDDDGKLDIAVGFTNIAQVGVLRNASKRGELDASSFASGTAFTTGGTDSRVIALADIDGDGKKDIVASGGDISILRNTMTPGELNSSSFAAYVALGIATSTVASVDIDGDGKLDVASTNSANGDFSIFRNISTIGTISLDAKVDFPTGNALQVIGVGDLDGDGDADFAISDNSTPAVSVFRNLSTPGTISTAPRVDFTVPANPVGARILDIDGDGQPEVLTINSGNSSISVFHNIADPPTVSSISPTSARVGKTVTITGTGFDATGAKNAVYFGAIKANVATATTTSLTAEVPGGTKTITTGTLAGKVDFTAGIQPANVAIGDIDGDGKPDVAIPNFGTGSQTVSVYHNTSSTGSISGSSLASHQQFSSGGNTNSIAIGDLDGDGKLDMVVPNVNPTNTIGVFHNTSTSGVINGSTFAARDDFTSSTNPRDVALADLDGDGKLDIAAANAGSASVSFFRNTPHPGDIDANSFTAAQDFAAGTLPNGVAVGDVDGDGKIDIAVSNQTSNDVSVFRNTTTAGTNDASSFAAQVSFAAGTTPLRPTFADLDGDGKLEMVVSSSATDQVGVFRNTSTSGTINASTFATRVDYTTGDGPQKIAAGDLDGDGRSELVVENQAGSTVSVFKNNSVSGTINASSFAAKVDFTTGSAPAGVALGDLDGDGRPELAVANNGSNSLSVFRNQSDLETVGLSGTTTVSPGTEVQLFRIGLVSYGSYTLNGITLTLSDLSSTTGIISGDLELRLYRSTDETFDTGDTQIGTQSSVNIGTPTTISPSSAENPVDHSFYIATAVIRSTANDGNAFKIGFAQNGVTTSATSEGAAITASDSDNITVGVTATRWVFVAEPTGATHLQELVPQPGLEARDDNGNLDTNINGTVTLSVSPSGSLSQSTFTASNGVVPTGDVTISGAGSRTLIASGLGLISRHDRGVRCRQSSSHRDAQQPAGRVRRQS